MLSWSKHGFYKIESVIIFVHLVSREPRSSYNIRMSAKNRQPEQNGFTLAFRDKNLEQEFLRKYDSNVRLPLRYGIIISILSWYSAIGLIYAIVPEKASWLVPLTLIYIGSYFGFIVYATFKKQFKGYYELLGAISNAWAGLYAIYFCDQFPNGVHLTLPVLIFIIFFGSYMVRLRWLGGFVAAFTYTLGYHIYIANYSNLSSSQVLLYAFVGWMTLIFAILAGRVAESNNRLAFVQRKTIARQQKIIEEEKQELLKEVHHRVKNNLQIIVSLINLQLAKFEDKRIEVALREIQSRVASMSLVHQGMNQTSNFGEISLRNYTRQLLERTRMNHPEKSVNFDLLIKEEVAVDIETAIPLGLILNEILNNFFQHAETPDALKLKISTEKSEEGCLLICRDNGKGFPNGTIIGEEGKLGLELIDVLVDQLDGDFKFYSENGAVYEVRMEVMDCANPEDHPE